MSHVKISDRGGGGTVEVDGYDMSPGLLGYTLSGGRDQFPTLTLEVAMPAGEVAGQAYVHITDDCAAALTALGWTPPGAQGG